MVSKTRSRQKQMEKRRKYVEGFSILFITLAIFIVAMVASFSEKRKIHDYEQREQALLNEIEEQEARAQEIEELEAYTKTKKYVEDMAKERLGLSYENEIIFKASE